MSWLSDLSPINLFGFYLALVFCVSTLLRLRQYATVVALVYRFPGRWPKLLKLVGQHWTIFLSWGTLVPLAVMLGLLVANTLASQWLWPQAREFKLHDLLAAWPALPVVLGSGLAMLAFDAFGTWQVGEIDREQLEGYFDQAEHWLSTWKAPVVRFFTLGYINPRKMVAVEVRASLESAGKMLNSTFWWVSIQAGLRIAFGLSLWGTYALHGRIMNLIA
jgi:hypothetical protein